MAARDRADRGAEKWIVGAAIEVFGRNGYHASTLVEIAANARISVATVQRHYATREECFLAAYRQASHELVAIALEAYGTEADWATGLHAGLSALLEAAAADPARARVCFVEAQAAGRRAIHAREQTITRLEGLFDRAPEPTDGPRWPLLARNLVGGIDFIIQRRIAAGKTAELPDLAGDLAYLAAAPFIGGRAAERLRRGGGQGSRDVYR